MKEDQVMQEVKKAQAMVDALVPGKVRVEAEWCDESRAYYMVGIYDQYISEPGNMLTIVSSNKTEKMDRYYGTGRFAHFFAQRAAYMMASPEDQASFQGHPATYNLKTA
jgi:hypothetical protein